MGSSSGSQAANTSKTLRYAPYIEDGHSNLLNTVASVRADILNDSPYTTYSNQDIESAMFGAGYAISDFSALYDMFGKFLSGLDIEVLWNTAFNDRMQATEINGKIQTDIILTDDILSQISIPDFKLEMRGNNAVHSSSFVVGKAKIENLRTKELSKISSETKFAILPTVGTGYNTLLNWNKSVIDEYAALMKLYYITAITGSDSDSKFAASNSLWPFEVLDFERATLGTMRQAAGYQKTALERKRSDLSKALLVSSYMVNGAFTGSYIGGPYGAAIGAAVGFVVGVAIVLSE